MDSELEGYLLQLTSITQELSGTVGGLSESQFNWRPSSARWSIGQCIQHLNITLERYLPGRDNAMSTGRSLGRVAEGPFVASLFERWFIRLMEPPVRRRFKTSPAFVGAAELPLESTLATWEQLHGRLARLTTASEGLDRRRINVRSQFAPISLSIGATFVVLLAHERRHLWQAREVRLEAGFPAE